MFQTAHELTPHLALAPAGPRELCQLAKNWDGSIPEGGALVEEKINGWRCLWIDGELVTREGAPFYSVGHIARVLTAMEQRAGEPLFLDGEFQAGGSFDGTIAHQAQRGWADGAGVFHLFDALTLAEWRAGGSDMPLYARTARLAGWMKAIGAMGSVRLVPDQWAADAPEVRAMAQDVYSRGGEGVIIKDAMSPYVRARTGTWRKEKRSMR